jgi:hypothetical protein
MGLQEFGTATDETVPETALPDAVEVDAAGDVMKVAGTDRRAHSLRARRRVLGKCVSGNAEGCDKNSDISAKYRERDQSSRCRYFGGPKHRSFGISILRLLDPT